MREPSRSAARLDSPSSRHARRRKPAPPRRRHKARTRGDCDVPFGPITHPRSLLPASGHARLLEGGGVGRGSRKGGTARLVRRSRARNDVCGLAPPPSDGPRQESTGRIFGRGNASVTAAVPLPAPHQRFLRSFRMAGPWHQPTCLVHTACVFLSPSRLVCTRGHGCWAREWPKPSQAKPPSQVNR